MTGRGSEGNEQTAGTAMASADGLAVEMHPRSSPPARSSFVKHTAASVSQHQSVCVGVCASYEEVEVVLRLGLDLGEFPRAFAVQELPVELGSLCEIVTYIRGGGEFQNSKAACEKSTNKSCDISVS